MRHLLKGLLLAGLFALAGCATDKSVISQAVTTNDTLKPAIITDPDLSQYLQQVGDRIVATAKAMDKQGYGPATHFKKGEDNSWMFQGLQFHFVNSSTVNAFTTGGEHMYVYTALFDLCQSEDELAAVMSHEYAHVYCRHVQKGDTRQKAMLGVVAAGGVAGAAVGDKDNLADNAKTGAGVASAIASLGGNHYTSGDENEADKFGFGFYSHAGWDPTKFADLFTHLAQQQQASGQPTAGGPLASFESDHPPLDERVQNTQRRISELPPNASSLRKPDIATPERFSQLKARAKQIEASTPNDQSLKQAQQLLAAFPCCVSNQAQPSQIQARQQIQQQLNATTQAK